VIWDFVVGKKENINFFEVLSAGSSPFAFEKKNRAIDFGGGVMLATRVVKYPYSKYGINE
jgi:hypothetical protein